MTDYFPKKYDKMFTFKENQKQLKNFDFSSMKKILFLRTI